MPDLSYDTDHGPPRRHARAAATAAIAVAIALTVVVAFTVSRHEGMPSSGRSPAIGATAIAETADSAPGGSSGTTAAGRGRGDAGSASPLPDGRDAQEASTAPSQVVDCGRAFLLAWLATDPATRETGLKATATTDLAAQLMLTDPGNVPDLRPSGRPAVEGASATAATLVQQLGGADGQTLVVAVVIVADPQSRYGWLVQSIDRRS